MMRRARRMPPRNSAVPRPKPYVPDVRPFMRQAGYSEGLEEILREIDQMSSKNHFYYERGDLSVLPF